MADDEMMAKVAMILMQKYACEENNTETETKIWGLSRKEMDSWYKMGVDYYSFADPGCPYLQSQTQRVEAIVRITSSLVNNQKIFTASKKVPKRFFIACLHLAEYVHDNNLLIDKYDKCATELYNLDEKLYSDAETDYQQYWALFELRVYVARGAVGLAQHLQSSLALRQIGSRRAV